MFMCRTVLIGWIDLPTIAYGSRSPGRTIMFSAATTRSHGLPHQIVA